MKKCVLFFFVLIFTTTFAIAAEKPSIKGTDDKISYSVGQQVGRDLVRQRVDVRPEIILQGIMDAVNNDEPLVSIEEQVDVLATLKDQIVQSSELRRADLKKKGEDFLKENAGKEGIVSLDSGLQYKVIKKGEGNTPGKSDKVKVNYIGRNVLNMQISSSYQDGNAKPVEFEVSKVLPGVGEALTKMQEGDKWELYIPYHLAFNDRGPMAGQMIIFEVELLEILAQN